MLKKITYANKKLKKKERICPFCSKGYKHHSSLSRHKKICPNNVQETKTVNLKYLQALIEFAKSARDEILELKQRNKKLQAIVDKYSS
tara:strand:- start:253 stop:516 length:264 start_codon:yes stop_codon:yes gene_type:complete